MNPSSYGTAGRPGRPQPRRPAPRAAARGCAPPRGACIIQRFHMKAVQAAVYLARYLLCTVLVH